MMSKNQNNLATTWCICTVELLCALLPNTNAMAAEQKPDNAALLYYQAFLLCPNPNDIPQGIGEVFHAESGIDVEDYRSYVKDYQHMIQLAMAASNIPYCNWSIPYSQGAEVRAKLMPLTRSLALLIGANVRVLAADGEYSKALSQSLMLRQFAKHIANDPDVFEAVPITVDRVALYCVHFVLDVMPPNEKTLKSLREQLISVQPISELLPVRNKQNFEKLIRAIIKDPGSTFYSLRQKLAEKANDEAHRKEAMALTDNELLELIRESYTEFLDSVFKTMTSEMTYEQKYMRLEKLQEQYQEQAKNNPAIILPLKLEAGTIPGSYCIQVTHTALFNAVKAAIEIYLLKATTVRLPKVLPNGLPEDPFSGKDFEYEVTEKGFVLRCRVKDIKWGNVRHYEFKVQKEK